MDQFFTGIRTFPDVVHLNGGEPLTLGFCDQGFAVPKILVEQDGSFFIYGTGDDKLSNTNSEGTDLIDAMYLIKRTPDGKYDLRVNFQNCAQQISKPILAFEKDEYSDPGNGGKVGWVGRWDLLPCLRAMG